MQYQKSLTLHWHPFPGWGRERVSPLCHNKGRRWFQKEQWCTLINILLWTVGYLNGTRNRTTRIAKLAIGPTGSTKPSQTCRLTGMGLGWNRQEAVANVFGWVWNQTNLSFRFKPGLLAGHLDRLQVTRTHCSHYPRPLSLAWDWRSSIPTCAVSSGLLYLNIIRHFLHPPFWHSSFGIGLLNCHRCSSYWIVAPLFHSAFLNPPFCAAPLVWALRNLRWHSSA